jgi:hypothetical protein
MQREKYPFEIKLSKILPLRRTDHFNIYYYPGSYAEKDIEAIATLREKAYRDICAFLDTHAEIKTDLYLFEDGGTKKMETGHQGAGWAFDTVMVEIYNETAKCHPYHELVHVFSDGIYGTTVSFLSEGLAVYVSETCYDKDFGDKVNYNTNEDVIKHYRSNELFPLKEMFTFEIGPGISKPDISYPQAASLVKYLYKTLGKTKFYGLYRTLEDDYSDGGIKKNILEFEKCCGKSVDQVNTEWLGVLDNIHGVQLP